MKLLDAVCIVLLWIVGWIIAIIFYGAVVLVCGYIILWLLRHFGVPLFAGVV